MNLTVQDRLQLPTIVPHEGTILTQLTIRDILKKVEITAQDAEMIKLQQAITPSGVVYNWDRTVELVLNVTFTPAEMSILQGQAEKYDRDGLVTLNTLDLIIKLKKGEITEEA